MLKRISRVSAPLLRGEITRILNNRAYIVVRNPPHSLSRLSPSFRRFYSSQKSTSKACPSCGSLLGVRDISCNDCGALSPLPENVNYLSLFGLPSTPPFEFDLDVRKLKKDYLKMMSNVHPDSVIGKSEVQINNFYLFLMIGTNAHRRECLIDGNACLFNSAKTPLSSNISITPSRTPSSCYRILKTLRPRIINESS
jgi:hypothetical protein